MKLIEKIAYISFWINIFFVIFMFIGFPILIIKIPDFLDSLTSNSGKNPLNITLCFLNLIIVFHWGYCIWFLFKYDKYSKSIIPLFFLNCIYAPIYFYRVKIKKRLLRNKINTNGKNITEDKSISEKEFVDFTRNNVFGTINLWASKENQFDYQENAPEIKVSTELFSQWEDFYHPELIDFKQAFNKEELKILSEFDKTLNNNTFDKTSQNLSSIDKFTKSKEWIEINKKAIEIKNKLNTVGNNLYSA